MLTTHHAPACTTCGLSREALPEWAQDLGALRESAPGIYHCATTPTPILPPLPELDPTVRALLEHDLQLFAWLVTKVSLAEQLRPLRTAAEVVRAIGRIDEWANDTDTVIYKLRHWPTGRAAITTY